MRAMLVLLAVMFLVARVPASAAVGQAHGVAGFLAAEHPHDAYWGGPATDEQLADVGLTICAHHQRGLSDHAVYQAMVGGPSMVSPAGSEAERLGMQRVRNAVRHLCP